MHASSAAAATVCALAAAATVLCAAAAIVTRSLLPTGVAVICGLLAILALRAYLHH